MCVCASAQYVLHKASLLVKSLEMKIGFGGTLGTQSNLLKYAKKKKVGSSVCGARRAMSGAESGGYTVRREAKCFFLVPEVFSCQDYTALA